MAVPKRSDKLMQHKMHLDKLEHKDHDSTEDSEFNALNYDVEHGVNLLPHKMKRYLELKEKLKK
jgi:hypothetical protein